MKLDAFNVGMFVVSLAVMAGVCFGTSWLAIAFRERRTWRRGSGGSVEILRPGQCYEVVRAFQDYYANRFEVGERLTYKSRDYLPYHGGHTVVFEERTMYFQDEESAEVLRNLAGYLRPVTMS
jgi:hypothetical protein